MRLSRFQQPFNFGGAGPGTPLNRLATRQEMQSERHSMIAPKRTNMPAQRDDLRRKRGPGRVVTSADAIVMLMKEIIFEMNGCFVARVKIASSTRRTSTLVSIPGSCSEAMECDEIVKERLKLEGLKRSW